MTGNGAATAILSAMKFRQAGSSAIGYSAGSATRALAQSPVISRSCLQWLGNLVRLERLAIKSSMAMTNSYLHASSCSGPKNLWKLYGPNDAQQRFR